MHRRARRRARGALAGALAPLLRRFGIEADADRRRAAPCAVQRGGRRVLEELPPAGRELPLRPARRKPCWRACAPGARRSSRRRRRSMRRAGWRRAASTRSSRRGSRRAAIAAASCRTMSAPQLGTFALVPQIVDAVKRPGHRRRRHRGRRGVAAALALGAGGVQVGTAYLLCPEANTSAVHRAALRATPPASPRSPTCSRAGRRAASSTA